MSKHLALDKKVQAEILAAVHGSGFRARVAAAAARPKLFPATGGFEFKPEWQDDALASEPAKNPDKK